ncbi:MAG: Na+/H+ antiporter NhaA [Rhodothermaceae bacterium]|nr:Na+/H+ antiporter NhaA [Rhodothermaceae bacterium]
MKSLNKALIPRPFQEFFNREAGSGLLLILCTIIALVWANSGFSGSYTDLWKTYFTVEIGGGGISKPLILWVNDGLMAIFFFVVGLEIKRELISGELSSPKKAALPLMAALGGAVIPALIYVGLNLGTAEVGGWGVPMATDIAFALGVLALLGSKTPLSLKIFVTALAIVDDLMAVLVIALFYTAKISFVSLAIGFVFLGVAVLLNRLGIHKTVLFVLLGIATWVAFLKSGVHATIAGVLFAATIPAQANMGTGEFLKKGEKFIEKVRDQMGNEGDQRTAIHYLEVASRQAQTPLERMEHGLHSWVAFGVMPIFALANAGVAIAGDVLSELMSNAVFWGIFLGLFAGKPLGIVAMVWIVVKTKIAELPKGVSWRHIIGAGALAGIGFTMALFIANLAFSDPKTLEIAKLGILTASLASGILGWILLSSSADSSEPVEQADLEVLPIED